jgi:uncharacterized sporulation protein YeaH/YhbH (DUF444 family)
MTEKIPTTNYIFVDRRKTGRGKSLPNRQRLLRRIKDAIKAAKPRDIDSGGVKNMGAGSSGGISANPVKVAKHSLHEPTFHYSSASGKHDVVLIGNDEWERGDDFPLSADDESAGPGEDTEDDFIVNISRDEYLNVFFEDCELPDLRETHERDQPSTVPKHAGFQKSGNAGQLSVRRSFKNSLGRRLALTKGARDELEELRAKLKLYEDGEHEQSKFLAEAEAMSIIAGIIERIQELEAKIARTPYFEDLDLRYTKKDRVLVKSAEAVFIMIMDISGSMDEDKKRLARKFFALQYAFIHRKYPQTDLVFIAHTETPEELSEEEFFTTRKSGGTVVSPAYELAHKIIKERYDARESNIYLSQASDGDNWDFDNASIIPALEESGLLSKIRHMSYAQVGQSFSSGFSTVTLWTVLKSISNTSQNKKLSMVKIDDDSEVFDAFHQIYKKQQ